MTDKQTDLRDRIAAAIWERQNPGRRWVDCEYRWRADAEADADAVLAVLPPAADRAAVLLEAAEVSARFVSDCQTCAVELEVARELRRLAAEAQQPDTEEEGELVCVDECGNCDACGMEPFGTPAEGWREAARFLRQTPRESADFPGAIRGARLIEDELRRRAEEAQQSAADGRGEEAGA